MEGLNGVIGAALFIFLLTGFCDGRLLLTPTQLLPNSQIFSAPGTTKIEIRNVTLEVLTKAELKNLNQDLTSLKILNSEIEEINRFAFDRLKHLNLLDLSNNNVKYIDPDTFSRLPGLEILVLKNLGLKNINLNLKNVQELILSGNKIESIGGSNITGENINYIDLSSNNISTLFDSFKGMSKLSMLDLSKNKINYIRDNVFENNTKLLRILISNNKLTSTNGLTLNWLKTLDLFENQIEYLLSYSFFEMVSLEELVLAFNKIKVIEDPFKDLIELKYLNLAWNQIESLEPNLFRNNAYLTKLALQGNRLKNLSRFKKVLYHLSHLDLSHNEISTISYDFFTSLPNINYLDLSFNRLTTVSDVLKPLGNLKVLGLAFNRIVLQGREFSENRGLTHLNLSSNGLDLDLSFFQNHVDLNSLDLSRNKIKNICDAKVTLKNLLKINLRENEITNVLCFNEKNFKSLCELDIRNNPLVCGEILDKYIWDLAITGCLPLARNDKIHSDIFFVQCQVASVDESIKLWNTIKREFCPEGADLYNLFNINEKIKSNQTEIINISKNCLQKGGELLYRNIHNRKIVNPDLVQLIDTEPQSERKSWEDIEDNSEFLRNFESDESDDENLDGIDDSFLKNIGWYLVVGVLMFLGIVVIITFFRLGTYMMLCIRLRDWGKSYLVTTKSYVVLSNEVYKRTTEPSPPTAPWIDEQLMNDQTKNATERKMKNYFHNLIQCKNGKNPDYDRNILINS